MALLDKKVAIVTGAGSGIGREVAYRFAAEGATVVVTDVDEAGGRETVSQIENRKGRGFFIRADSSSAKDNEAVVTETVKRFGGLHVAVNNAGVGGPSAPTGEYPVEGWDKVIAINLSGVFYGMRYQLPAMQKSGGGAIVNIASILGQVGFRNSPAYVAAKHGVVGLTKNAALEYATQNIRVVAVGPAFIKTPLLDKNLTPEVMKFLESQHAMNRLGRPEEVAELVLWLSSEKASFVTGSYYAVDGGYLSQ